MFFFCVMYVMLFCSFGHPLVHGYPLLPVRNEKTFVCVFSIGYFIIYVWFFRSSFVLGISRYAEKYLG